MHWLSFLIGVLIGWGVEWLIDYLYWRRRRGDEDDSEVDLRERLDKALGALQQMRIDLYDAQVSAKAEVAQLNQQLADAQGELAALRARLATAENNIPDEFEPPAEQFHIEERLAPELVEVS